ncbi:MAG TPA: DUF349 domain-containing protein [Thermoanaerobaculia bacterium]|nr:DUF349 domain-containing protein [Thermoanaerobaculia bacterium]
MSSSEEQNAEITENDLSFLQQEEDPSGSAEASGEPGEVSPHGDEPAAQEPIEASAGGTVDADVTELTDEAEASGEGGNGAGIPFPGTDWGYVDEEGNVRQKDTADGPGRIVGKMKGSDPNAALRFYVNKFRQITQRVEALERDMANEAQRARALGRIQSMIEWVPTAEALGDFDAVLERLRALEGQALEAAQRNLEQKEALCARAEELSESPSWKATGEALKALQEEWKAVGPAPKEQSDAVWKRFRAAQSRFFDRRKEHFGRLAQEQQENLKRKEELAVRAEELAESSDWKATAEALKTLQEEWKSVGPAPRDQADAVWKRFRKGLNRFFDRRKEHFDRLGKEQKENYRRKEELCVRAEEVAESSDWKATAEALKALQEEWRTIGPAPKDKAEAVWARFRAANDKFFNRRSEHFQERDKDRGARQSEWKERLQESLERKREQVERLKESIGRDRDNVERWQASLAAVRPGPREAELRESLEVKIADVGKRLQSKESRLVELEDSIKEIEAKL